VADEACRCFEVFKDGPSNRHSLLFGEGFTNAGIFTFLSAWAMSK